MRNPDWLQTLARDRLIAEISLWSADLTGLASSIESIDDKADMYHLDAADGHFSPALLFFPDLVASVRKLTSRPLHVHLMAADSILRHQIQQFAGAGADMISIHAENSGASEHLKHIKSLGLSAGLVLQLSTNVEAVADLLPMVTMLTLLGTKIGIKGQGLDAQAEQRMRRARNLIDLQEKKSRALLAADGGIREDTLPMLAEAGADSVVLGSLAFDSIDLQSRFSWLRKQSRGGVHVSR